MLGFQYNWSINVNFKRNTIYFVFVNKEAVIPQIDKNIFVFVKNELRIPGYIIDEINVER